MIAYKDLEEELQRLPQDEYSQRLLQSLRHAAESVQQMPMATASQIANVHLSLPASDRAEDNAAALFFESAADGDIEGVRQMIDNKEVHVNQTDVDGFTALMIACAEGQEEIVNLLLEKNASLTIRTLELGSIALHFAAKVRRRKYSALFIFASGICYHRVVASLCLVPTILTAGVQEYLLYNLLFLTSFASPPPYLAVWKC